MRGTDRSGAGGGRPRGRRSTQPAGPRAEGRWTVGLHDGFDGTTLDGDLWGTCFWWDEGDGCTILGNDEEQWYVPEQVSVADGLLRLTAQPEESRHFDRPFPYASGMVSSGRPADGVDDVARCAFTYGSVEVRFPHPGRRGPVAGGVDALPVTNESLPEIDLLEQYGDDPTRASMTLHAMEDGEQVRNRGYVDTADLSEGWHTVGIDWTEDRLVWLYSARSVQVEGSRVPREPMYLVANLAVGGGACGRARMTPSMPRPSAKR